MDYIQLGCVACYRLGHSGVVMSLSNGVALSGEQSDRDPDQQQNPSYCQCADEERGPGCYQSGHYRSFVVVRRLRVHQKYCMQPRS